GPRHASSTPGNDTFPAATALTNSSDGFVIVTQDPLGLRFLYSAYGQAFTKSVPGTLSSGGGAFAKAIGPRVTPLDDGGFIVAWVDTTAIEGDGSPDLKVVLQRFDKNSNAVGQNLIINNPGDQSLESIATLDDGRVILTYTTETGDSTGQTRLAYRIIDPREPTIFGTSRADNIVGRQDGSTIISGAGDDTLIGSAVADTLQGEIGADTLDSAGGDDILNGGLGPDILIGGAGKDIYVLENGTDNVIDSSGIDTITSTINRSLSGLYAEVENLTIVGNALTGTGNASANAIIGNAKANTLIGNGGGDTLKGVGGIDKLTGGLGLDKLYGGASNDIFVFNVALTAANRDIIYDFNVGNDTIQLENAVFTQVGPVGPLRAMAFKLSTQVKDADDRIIYNKTTGGVFYDSDGSGTAAPILFATLMNKPVVTAADFVVI
ncbi:MAG TPA: hypothetical protein VMF90_22570, partial [Rhizobiaceae bacterium]|nr:hypothetical protein [Rhizobiaceae bacterium]